MSSPDFDIRDSWGVGGWGENLNETMFHVYKPQNVTDFKVTSKITPQ